MPRCCEDRVGSNQLLRSAGRLRAAEEEALGVVAAVVDKQVENPGILDAFGDDTQPEVVCQVDGRAHDHLVVARFEKVGDERPIDLDLVDWQPLQVGKR